MWKYVATPSKFLQTDSLHKPTSQFIQVKCLFLIDKVKIYLKPNYNKENWAINISAGEVSSHALCN